jgi:hypothetical protein
MGHIAGSEILRGSLWIRPTGLAMDTLQHAVRRIQDKVGGPGAIPHVTLLVSIEMSRLDAERRLKELAASFLPFTIYTGKLDWSGEYYRSLFARVEASAELLAVRRRAQEIFNQNPRDPYEPHVSLYYGELDELTKRAIVEDFGGTLDVEFEAQSVHLTTATRGVPVEEWRSVLEVDFNYREIAEGRARPPRKPPQHARNMPKA